MTAHPSTTCMTVLATTSPATTVARLLATAAGDLLFSDAGEKEEEEDEEEEGDTNSMANATRLLVHTMTVMDCTVCRVYEIPAPRT